MSPGLVEGYERAGEELLGLALPCCALDDADDSVQGRPPRRGALFLERCVILRNERWDLAKSLSRGDQVVIAESRGPPARYLAWAMTRKLLWL